MEEIIDLSKLALRGSTLVDLYAFMFRDALKNCPASIGIISLKWEMADTTVKLGLVCDGMLWDCTTILPRVASSAYAKDDIIPMAQLAVYMSRMAVGYFNKVAALPMSPYIGKKFHEVESFLEHWKATYDAAPVAGGDTKAN